MIKVNAYRDMLRFDWIETYGRLEKKFPGNTRKNIKVTYGSVLKCHGQKKGQDSTACQINCREIFLLISYFNYQTDLSTKKCKRNNFKNAPKSFKT